jgi:hypothetical protein
VDFECDQLIYAVDPESAGGMWNLSEDIVGQKFEY